MTGTAVMTFVERGGVTVVCLTNVTGDQADEMCFRITDALAPGFTAKASSVVWAIESAAIPFKPLGGWFGESRGATKTSAGDLPVTMIFEAGGDIKIAIEHQYPTPLDDPKLPVEETPTHYHRVEVGLRLDHDRLYGFALANLTNDEGHFELPTISLKRASAH
jgi:hypothetical protein